MRRLFFGIALAAGMLWLWGWDAVIVAAPTPPVATDTDTAVKLELLQRRLEELERKEQKVQDARETDQRQFYEIRERDRKDTEKQLREFEDILMQDVDRETQKTKEWVEYGNKKVERWLSFLSVLLTALGIIMPLASFFFAKQAKDSERLAKEELEKIRKIHEQANNKYCDIEKTSANANSLIEEIKRASHDAKQTFEDIKNEKEKFSSLLVTQTKPDEPPSPSSLRAAKIASEQDEDKYSKFVGEAVLAQEKEDYSAALKAWEEAARVDQNAAQAHFGIGLSKQMLADKSPLNIKIKLLNEARDSYLKSISINPNSLSPYNNLGNTLIAIAKSDPALSKNDRQMLYLNACNQYAQAQSLQPDSHIALNNWGAALTELATEYTPPDSEKQRERLLTACEKFEQACRIKPDFPEALYTLGSALLHISSPKLTNDAAKQLEFRNLAESKILEARRINPKIGAYNLARVTSLTNRPDECRKWLRESLDDDDFPGCDHIRTDTDLDPVRNEQWFKDFLAEVCPEDEAKSPAAESGETPPSSGDDGGDAPAT